MSEVVSVRKKKVVFAGEAGVGKTSVARAVSDVGAERGGPTVGADFFVVRERDRRSVIFDLSGQERFQPLAPDLARGAEVVVMVFDVSRPETLEALVDWAPNLPREARVILVANKADLGWRVSREEVLEVAAFVGAEAVVVTSARDGRGIGRLRRIL